MPQITLTTKQTTELSAFISNNDLTDFFIAKDHGAYIGAYSEKDGSNYIVYFKGCNPEKDEHYYDEAYYKFGGDDFGEHIPADFLHRIARAGRRLRVTLTSTTIKQQAVR